MNICVLPTVLLIKPCEPFVIVPINRLAQRLKVVSATSHVISSHFDIIFPSFLIASS